MDTDCPFCKIVAVHIASVEEVVGYPPNTPVVIIDAKDPQAPIHKLCILAEHSHKLEDLQLMFGMAHKYARAKYSINGYRLVVNVGRDSGATISHPHIHILAGGPLGKIAGPITGG